MRRSPSTDVSLLRAARTDAGAFEAFYVRWAVPLHGWLREQVPDAEAANDLTAETFAQALLALPGFRGEHAGSGAAWLWGIARNLVRQHYRAARLEDRARRQLAIPVHAYDIDVWDGADARVAAAALARELADAVAGLSPEQRRALELRVCADLDFGAIAEHLGCTEPAARMRVSRALQVLRSRMQGLW
jgi:RNA polymerase sigma-70 factor (ECF subfamily)